MSSLPPKLDLVATEEEICKKWREENTFYIQNKLSLKRGDEVRSASWGFIYFATRDYTQECILLTF